MGRKCCVDGCSNAKYNSRIPGTIIHAFPKEVFRKRWLDWLEAINVDKFTKKVENFGICSLHFSENSYKGDVSKKKSLRVHEDPSIKLIEIGSTSNVQMEHDNESDLEMLDVNDIQVDSNSDANDRMYSAQELKLVETKLHDERLKSRKLQKLVSKKDIKIRNLNRRLHSEKLRQKLLASKCASVKSKLVDSHCKYLQMQQQYKSSKSENNSYLSDTMKHIFTSDQLAMIIDKKSKTHWSDEDISRGISLFSLSSKCYSYLRDVCKFPLPSKSTLKNYISKIDFSPGMLRPVLNVMQSIFQNSTPMRRQVIIAHDEVAISPLFCYDEKEDKIYGGSETIMAVFLRGLFYDWRQIVYYSFDGKKFCAKELLEIIAEVEKIGINVVGSVCDNVSTNQGIWRDLNVNYATDTHFPNPVTGKNVHCFSDFPHCIKLIRKAFNKNKYFRLDPKADKVNFAHTSVVEKLIDLEKDDYEKVCHKLTSEHINPILHNQNVRKAFELFSNTVARAMLYITSDFHTEATAKFFQLVNNWSDLMNVGLVQDNSNHMKCPYGMYKDEQDRILDEMHTIILEMRVGGGNRLSPFQKGIAMSIKSLKGLFEDMKQEPVNAKYILTKNTNQDFVENAFSRFRGFGSFNMKPNAVDAKRRLKSLSLSYNYHRPKNAAVAITNDSDCQLVSGLLRKLCSDEDQSHNENSQVDISSWEISSEFVSPPTNQTTMSVREKCKVGSHEYIAGYIARKLMNSELIQQKDKAVPSSWVNFLSNGNLVEPSTFWKQCYSKMDEYFQQFHDVSYGKFRINTQCNVTKSLTEIIATNMPLVHENVIKFFVRTRTLIRIKAMNQKILLQQRRKFATKSPDLPLAFETQEELYNAELSLVQNCEFDADILHSVDYEAYEAEMNTESQDI